MALLGGGMAVVYLAKDLRHDRKVAIKVLNPDLSATLGTERFLREIDVIAQLEHPNILTLIDSGEVEGLPNYVMPYVKGHSLAALLEKERRLPLAQALRIAAEVAEALETAHKQGVIHRDIMPSVDHNMERYGNNLAEVSHQPTRQRKRQMRGFKSVGQTQRFLSVHGVIRNLFNLGLHRLSSANYRLFRERSFKEWSAATAG
jgi:hypothetical protein